MASLSFPTTIFENFEIHLPCSVTGTVSLSPRHNASAVLMPAANIHGLVDQRSSVDSSVQISSFEKNGHKIWRIHLSSSQELHEAGTRDLQGPTPISSQHQATSDSQYYHPIPDSYSISSNESVMDQLSWNTIHEMLSIAPTQSSFSLDNNQQSPGEPISLSAQLSASGSSDHSSSPLQYGEPVQEYQLSPSSPSVQSSPETYTSEDEDSHSPAQRTLFRCTAPNCTKTFKRAHSRNTHVKRSHSLHGNSSNGTTPNTHRCTAPNCGEQFTRSHDRMRHEFSQHGICGQFSCSKCHRVFGSPSRLERHLVDKHSNS